MSVTYVVGAWIVICIGWVAVSECRYRIRKMKQRSYTHGWMDGVSGRNHDDNYRYFHY